MNNKLPRYFSSKEWTSLLLAVWDRIMLNGRKTTTTGIKPEMHFAQVCESIS